MYDTTHQRPIVFIARSWSGIGGMQRLNRDVARHVGGMRAGFLCIHPERRTCGSFLSFVFRSLLAALEYRAAAGRVHVADAAALPLGYLCARLGSMKLSVTAHGLDIVHPNPLYQLMMRFFLRRADRVICVSQATADEVRKRGIPDDRITVIPCGIAPAYPFPESERDPFVLLTVGRLVRRKGVAWFLEHVFPSLLREFPSLRYVIAGDGPERRKIGRLVRRLKLEHAVGLFPSVSDEEKQQLMSQCTLFVAPNIRMKGDMEGFGIVCLEAAATGLPVAAARIEGLQDAVIDGTTGMFFESGHADDCVRVVTQMIRHPLDAPAVHDAILARFAWDALAPHYDDVFDS